MGLVDSLPRSTPFDNVLTELPHRQQLASKGLVFTTLCLVSLEALNQAALGPAFVRFARAAATPVLTLPDDTAAFAAAQQRLARVRDQGPGST